MIMGKAGYISLKNMKTKYLVGGGLLLLMAAICLAFGFTGNDDFDLARQEILLRDIGHRVLLRSGDSTSRVMPVKKIAQNEYQIRFENDFTFQSDSLVKIINYSLTRNKLTHNYIVNVLDCSGKNVIFGYAMASDKKDNIVPCSRRKQPKTCYVIDIKFQNSGKINHKVGYLASSISLLAFIGLVVSSSVKNRRNKVEAIATGNDTFKIGQIIFDPKNRQLLKGDLTIELTLKENKLLLIFVHSSNVIVQRSRLQKEIWEDEGVIVGRSLDVFISKLRKKLEIDPSIQLVNIHGKGYKLEVVA
jgi:hypothetical protein